MDKYFMFAFTLRKVIPCPLTGVKGEKPSSRDIIEGHAI